MTFHETNDTVTVYTEDRDLIGHYTLKVGGSSKYQTIEVDYNFTVSHPCERADVSLSNSRTTIGYVIGFSDVIHEIPYYVIDT